MAASDALDSVLAVRVLNVVTPWLISGWPDRTSLPSLSKRSKQRPNYSAPLFGDRSPALSLPLEVISGFLRGPPLDGPPIFGQFPDNRGRCAFESIPIIQITDLLKRNCLTLT